MAKASKEKKGPGRPKAIKDDGERSVSVTASMKVKYRNEIETKYGSLTKAVEKEIIPKLKK